MITMIDLATPEIEIGTIGIIDDVTMTGTIETATVTIDAVLGRLEENAVNVLVLQGSPETRCLAYMGN